MLHVLDSRSRMKVRIISRVVVLCCVVLLGKIFYPRVAPVYLRVYNVHVIKLNKQQSPFGMKRCQDICLRGTDNVQGQISKHIFTPNGDYHVYYPSNLLRNVCSFENWDIFSDIPQFQLGDIWSRDVFRAIAHERSDLMDYNQHYIGSDQCFPFLRTGFSQIQVQASCGQPLVKKNHFYYSAGPMAHFGFPLFKSWLKKCLRIRGAC